MVATAAVIDLLCATRFLDIDQRQAQVALRFPRGFHQQRTDRRIGVLQRLECDLGRGIDVLERIDQLFRHLRRSGRQLAPPLREQRGDLVDLGVIGRWLQTLAAPRPDQVVDQRQAAAGRDGPDFVPAVGVEGRKGDLGCILAAERETHLAPLMADQQLAARVRRGQHDDQGGEHARQLLGVTMAEEEAALVIHQHLVQLRADRTLHAEPLGAARHDRLQVCRPVSATDVDLLCTDLPGASYLGIDQGVGATPIGGPLGDRSQFRRLLGQQRQGDRTDTIDADARREDLLSARNVKIAWPLDRAQHLGKCLVDT